MPLITYLTTTYNRESDLKCLYTSLKSQSVQNFKWLIIDDGSIDGTEKLVQQWVKVAPFQIKYYKKRNAGKHRALNFGIPLLDTELVMVIDSDDWLVKDCSKIISDTWRKYSQINGVRQLTFERGINEKKPMVKIHSEVVAPRFDYIEKHRLFGDYNDVFQTRALQEFRLPEFEGEKFMSEGPLYYEFSSKYMTAFVPKMVAVGDYQEGGLTDNIRKLQIKNFRGALYQLELEMSPRSSFFGRLKHATLFNYIALLSEANYWRACKSSKHTKLLLVCFPISIIFIIKDRLI